LSDYSVDDFRSRAGRLATMNLRETGDYLLNPDIGPLLQAAKLKDAAVLIGMRAGDAGSRIVLTQRTAHLRKHAGQVAFPGGAIDPEDGTPERAALREAQEEIGLDPALVEIVGRLPDYLTTTGFRIKPVLAVIAAEARFVVNPDEVDAVFEVPVSFLMNLDNHRPESRVWQGIERHYFSMEHDGRLIWGVTAGIIRMMHERLYR
jgi:8-oxo-dGTP pyrophosphatase MutT (NUDIX family)